MATNLVTRVSVDTLSDASLALLRQGYAAMQAISDNRGFNAIAGLHGIPGHYCHHPNSQGIEVLFLPWHRAYLYYFEQYLQDRAAGATIPWWDWTSDISHKTGIPAAFSAAKDASGNPNSLLKSHIFQPAYKLDRDTTRKPHPPKNLPTADQVEKVLELSEFLDFSEQLQNIHNAVHDWVAGDMGSIDVAAFDPIFYSHHAMIDRLWYLWQIKNAPGSMPPELLDQVLAPFNMTVRTVLDISKLGYQYAVGQISG
jgi:tyrosinase